MFRLGEAWVHLGLLQTLLLAPRGPVDPNYRLSVQLNYAIQDLKNIECELDIRVWHETLLTGEQKLESTHPIIDNLYRRRDKLKLKIEEKSKLVAFRSKHVRFLSLLQDVEQFVGGIGSTERILKLISRLCASLDDVKNAGNAVEEQHTVLQSSKSFIARIEHEYQNYRDMTVPFLSAVAQTQHGLTLMAQAVHSNAVRNRIVNTLGNSSLESFVRVVGSFPTVSEATSVKRTVEQLVSTDFHSLLTSGIHREVSSPGNGMSPAELQSRFVLYS